MNSRPLVLQPGFGIKLTTSDCKNYLYSETSHILGRYRELDMNDIDQVLAYTYDLIGNDIRSIERNADVLLNVEQ